MFHNRCLLLLASCLLLAACATEEPDVQSTTSLREALPVEAAPAGDAAEPVAEAVAEVIEDHDPAAAEHPPCPSHPRCQAGEWLPHNDSEYRDHYSEAVLLLEEGRTDEAIEALRMELFDAPDSAITCLLLGQTYASVGQTQKGIDLVHEAIAFEPDMPDSFAFLAELHLEKGQPAEAMEAAERLVELLPRDPEANHLLARSQMGLAMWSEAITTCKRTIALDSGFTRAYNNLGFSALQIGKNELALQYLEAAAELPDVEAYMLNNLGIAHERSGDKGQALRTWRRALDLRPGYGRAAVNFDRVEQEVDEEIADELARILAERDAAELEGSAEAKADVAPTEGTSRTP